MKLPGGAASWAGSGMPAEQQVDGFFRCKS
jgi:hypothetical protein